MILFFSIAIVIYSLANFYIFYKSYRAIPGLTEHRLLYISICVFLSVIFIAAKILESRHSSVLTDILNIVGGFWLAFLLYAFFLFLFSDIVCMFLKITEIINNENIVLYRHWVFIITISISSIMIIGGFINAIIPVTREYNIIIDKSAGNIKTFRIAAVSDIHLGSVIRKRSIKKLSTIIEKMKPDVILLLGDIVDGEIGPVLRDDLLQYFRVAGAKDRLFAITGNHEYIGGASRTIPYIESKGIRILKDEIVTLTGGIQIAGRLDRNSGGFSGKERKPLDSLMKNINHEKPVILLDHQPFHLEESVKNKVDLQLSGHTHNGQMWPLNYVTGRIYELSHGYLRKGQTQFIVSSGYGLWGPRVRSGSRSEVLLINITFTGIEKD